MKKLSVLFILILLAILPLAAVTTSSVEKDEQGWRFFVNDNPFPIYGMVWSYTPVGEGNGYTLWDKPEDFIRKTIDTDMTMLKDMGINMIRCFEDVPPKWIEYIYHEYGITTMINNLLGRYGVTANGIWYSTTDYSDQYTQEELIDMARQTALKYKDTDGVVMYMLGNESNYGLVWKSSEIEDLPTENQDAVKAGYLYDLLEKAMVAIKEVDPNRTVGFINGDILNLELIEKLCPTLEIFGVNVYRGESFGDGFYDTVADAIDTPILITESGADAFNALRQTEDQWMQAHYFRGQWKDIYEHAYGKGKSSNILGAFIFEWLDEWWKIYQTQDLDLHNTHATWANSGYTIDYQVGVNNMDEEWFGIASQGVDNDGIANRVPRAAYYLLQDVFTLDLFSSTKEDVSRKFDSLNMNEYLARGNANTLDDKINDRTKIRITSASVGVDMVKPFAIKGETEDTFDQSAKGRLEASLGILVKPFDKLEGGITLRTWTSKPDNTFEDPALYYNDYNFALDSGYINYTGENIDIAGHYHHGMGGYTYLGDVFSLVPDSYDTSGVQSAPIAVEIKGKNSLAGFRAVAGTEVYADANHQAVVGYSKSIASDSASAPSWTYSVIGGAEWLSNDNKGKDFWKNFNTKLSLSGSMAIEPWVDVSLSALMTGTDKVGMEYITDKGSSKNISFLDTLGAQLVLTSNMFSRFSFYVKADYRGLVADTNAVAATSYLIGTDTGKGNRLQAEGGLSFTYGPHLVQTLYRFRTPLQEAANRGEDSPFLVSSNRRSQEIELAYTYDNEGMTTFYSWDNQDKEGSKVAAGVALLAAFDVGATDEASYKDANGATIYVDGSPALSSMENVKLPLLLQAKGKVIYNVLPGLKMALNLSYAYQMANYYGDSYMLNSYSIAYDVRWNDFLLLTEFKVDSLGAEEWKKSMGISYPYQWKVDLRYGFKLPSFLNATNVVGIKWQGKVFGNHSADSTIMVPNSQLGGCISDLTLYMNISW